MGVVTLTVAGRRYELAVRSGQETHFERLGALIDERALAVTAGMGGINEGRQLLMTALALADDLAQAQFDLGKARATVTPPPPKPAPDLAPQLAELAERLESLADRLEKGGAAS